MPNILNGYFDSRTMLRYADCFNGYLYIEIYRQKEEIINTKPIRKIYFLVIAKSENFVRILLHRFRIFEYKVRTYLYI